MERVGVLHGELGEAVKVFGLDRSRHVGHSLWNDVLDAVLQQRRGLHGPLHARRAGRCLFQVGHDADQGLQIRPMLSVGYLDRERVVAVLFGFAGRDLAHLPRNEPAKEGAAG